MVGTVGLEPTCIKRLILSEMGIPIPPRAHISLKTVFQTQHLDKPLTSPILLVRQCGFVSRLPICCFVPYSSSRGHSSSIGFETQFCLQHLEVSTSGVEPLSCAISLATTRSATSAVHLPKCSRPSVVAVS